MSRLELAQDRLTVALENLGKTAQTLENGRQSLPDVAPRLAALEAEREQLLARVAELEEELAALSGVTSEVESRLDGAIGEIRAALAR